MRTGKARKENGFASFFKRERDSREFPLSSSDLFPCLLRSGTPSRYSLPALLHRPFSQFATWISFFDSRISLNTKAGRIGAGGDSSSEEEEASRRSRRLSLAHCSDESGGSGGGSSSCDILRLPFRVALAEDMVARADSPHFRLLGKRERERGLLSFFFLLLLLLLLLLLSLLFSTFRKERKTHLPLSLFPSSRFLSLSLSLFLFRSLRCPRKGRRRRGRARR